eukprot:6213650-Pleurochrysis_carterae.AAC.2
MCRELRTAGCLQLKLDWERVFLSIAAVQTNDQTLAVQGRADEFWFCSFYRRRSVEGHLITLEHFHLQAWASNGHLVVLKLDSQILRRGWPEAVSRLFASSGAAAQRRCRAASAAAVLAVVRLCSCMFWFLGLVLAFGIPDGGGAGAPAIS